MPKKTPPEEPAPFMRGGDKKTLPEDPASFTTGGERKPPPQEHAPFMTGGDWSVGINSPTSLQQVELLTVLGRGLQKLYDGVLEEGVPEHLAPLLDRLRSGEDRS